LVSKKLALECPHRPPCPGCPRFGEPGPHPEAGRALFELAQKLGVPEPVFRRGKSTGFRYRARLAIRGRLGSPKIGIFEENTHRVVHIPRCLVHHPLINQVAEVVRRALVEHRVPPYSDGAHAGLARYLAVSVERASESAQVVLVMNAEPSPAFAPLFETIARDLGPRLHSLFHNTQTERTNTILGREFVRVKGPESTVEELGGARVHYPAGAFGQSNLELFSELVRHVHELVPERSSVVELYAGSGAIGLGLLAKSERLVFNEIGAASLRGLELGLAELPEALRTRAEVAPGPAASAVAHLARADVVIADPPRKGLDAEVLAALIAERPKRFVYVSCGLDSFLTQAQSLALGGYRLEQITVFELFPFSDHVEVVGAFRIE
jgi:tRNA/tmRNA/rRNA uracil-C5-methylase (TrmA/RlmC/RlmD family)